MNLLYLLGPAALRSVECYSPYARIVGPFEFLNLARSHPEEPAFLPAGRGISYARLCVSSPFPDLEGANYVDEIVRNMQSAVDKGSAVRFRPLSVRMGVGWPS
jgi:hypothetical protein